MIKSKRVGTTWTAQRVLCICTAIVMYIIPEIDGSDIETVSSTFSSEEIEHILKLHNVGRDSVVPPAANMKSMVWDKAVEVTAQYWASNCEWRHGNVISRESHLYQSRIGQNLYAVAGTTRPRVDDIMKGWYSEEKEWYDHTSNTCQEGRMCGHYKQAVWWNSYLIGCGIILCHSGSRNAFEDYDGPCGNIKGQLPYVSGTPCSLCTQDTLNSGDCVSGLCLTKHECSLFPDRCAWKSGCEWAITCYNQGTPTYENCSCICTEKWSGTDCREEKCPKPIKCANGRPYNFDSCRCECGEYFTGHHCEKPLLSKMGDSGRDNPKICTVPGMRRLCDYHLVGTTELVRHMFCPQLCGGVSAVPDYNSPKENFLELISSCRLNN
ncbi:GLIPR1-like protein 1 isoform X2 [Lingula anatina]|uniref:GLIPR1-like protein 1 isoform X2 n=1 Tax=Lingula anatina TaxID=7574 RepID=A0A1S3KE91_LINAN|nr:GLIPR1-like protein 1 isoform X2 [Lingula anatina]|eukprot:XP_013420817.1 GLIPR1-like protein 1 isoform X2 [Lingula anatina]